MALSPELEKLYRNDLSIMIKKEKPMELTLKNSPLKEVFEQAFFEMGVEKGISLGELKGVIKGELKGELCNKAKTALKMLKANKDISEIVEFTELTERDMNLLSAYYNQFGVDAINHLRFDGKQIDVL